VVYKRKRLRPAITAVGGLLGVAFIVYASIPSRVTAFGGEVIEIQHIGTVKAVLLGGMFGLLFLAGVMALARSRHPIAIDDDGVADRAAFPEKIRWPAVENVQMVGSEKNGYRIEILSGGRGRLIEIGDVEAAPGSVFQEIFENWTKHRR
jgi:hypothetical protein